MALKALNIYFFFTLLILLVPVQLSAQILQRDSDSLRTAFIKDSIRVSKGNLIAFQDSIFTDTDTLIIRKEVWVREIDSLIFKMDFMRVQDERMLHAEAWSIKIKDTLIIIQDTVISRNERVLQQIKEFSERDNFFSSLLKNILVFDKDKSITVQNPAQNSDKSYEPYEGKKIRNIEVKVLDVFGYSMNNPESRPHGFLEKSGNVIHLKSQRWLIRNRLLFKKGDSINSLKVSESERLLRSNSYIYDARISVIDTFSQDSVDVQVVVQDVWSISMAIGFDVYAKRYDASIRDVNFLGLGQTLDARLRYDPSFLSKYSFLGAYSINNISRTLISGRLYYNDEYGQKLYGAQFNREFISPALKWAGGVNLNAAEGTYELRDQLDSIISRQPTSSLQTDLWLGYGVNIAGNHKEYKGSRFIVSGRFINNDYYQTPVLPDSIDHSFYSSNFYLGLIGITRTRYYKDSYIFRFGRTEDIPEGDVVSITAGLHDRFYDQRPYLGANWAIGRYSNIGYVYTRLSAGSFYENSKWKEGVGLAHFLYFSPLNKLGKWRWRNFLGCRYTRGINPIGGAFLYVNQEQGLRGFKSSLVRGTSKLVLNYELNLFPPLNLLGFRMAFVTFADLAWIGNKQKLLDKSNFFSGYGIGLRFRNDHLIFNTIQILLGYYPNVGSLGEKEFILYERSRFYYNFYDLGFSRPFTLPFF